MAVISAIWNNATVTTFSVNVADGSVAPLYSAAFPTGLSFIPVLFGAEIGAYYGSYSIADGGTPDGARLASMDPTTGAVTRLVDSFPVVNGIPYDLFRDGVLPNQASSWKGGVLVVVPRIATPYVGGMTTTDLLSYSNSKKEFVCQIKSEELTPLAINEQTALSSNSNGETVFDASNILDAIQNGIPFVSAVYYYTPVNNVGREAGGCLAPQMIAGPGKPLFPGDLNTSAAAAAIGEDGTIILQYTYRHGNGPYQRSLLW